MEPDVTPLREAEAVAEPLVRQLVGDEPLRAPVGPGVVGAEGRQPLGLERDLEVVVGDDDGVGVEGVGAEEPGEELEHLDLPGEAGRHSPGQPGRVHDGHGDARPGEGPAEVAADLRRREVGRHRLALDVHPGRAARRGPLLHEWLVCAAGESIESRAAARPPTVGSAYTSATVSSGKRSRNRETSWAALRLPPPASKKSSDVAVTAAAEDLKPQLLHPAGGAFEGERLGSARRLGCGQRPRQRVPVDLARCAGRQRVDLREARDHRRAEALDAGDRAWASRNSADVSTSAPLSSAGAPGSSTAVCRTMSTSVRGAAARSARSKVTGPLLGRGPRLRASPSTVLRIPVNGGPPACAGAAPAPAPLPSDAASTPLMSPTSCGSARRGRPRGRSTYWSRGRGSSAHVVLERSVVSLGESGQRRRWSGQDPGQRVLFPRLVESRRKIDLDRHGAPEWSCPGRAPVLSDHRAASRPGRQRWASQDRL